MSKVFTIVSGLSVLVFWVVIAMSLDVPPPDLMQGSTPLSQAFLFGFMLIPKAFGQLVLLGASTLL